MHEYTPEAAQAIESPSRQLTHRLMIDWDRNGWFAHQLSDMSRFVTRTSRDQALSSTAPEEVMLIEGSAAASLEVEVAGEYKGVPLTGQFAPYNGRSVFYANGIDSVIGADMYYDIGVWTDNGWEWYRQFTGVVRDIEASRETGIVRISCLDNVEKMRGPVRIPPYAMYRDYLTNGFKRAQLVDSSSVIDLAARSAGFSMGPRGYDRFYHAKRQSNGKYAQDIFLKIPFHGSHLPEVGALDNEFEFHLTEQWENGTDAEKARKEQFRTDGPHGYLALNAVPRGANTWGVKKYWCENMETFRDGDDFWNTTVLGTWLYWTGNGVDESGTIISVDTQHVDLQLIVEGSNGGVNARLVNKAPNPDVLYDGNWMFMSAPGWYYIEAAFYINPAGGIQLRTTVNSSESAIKSHAYNMPGLSDYSLNGLVTVRNKYALSDLVVARASGNDLAVERYNHTLYDNADVSTGRNRITYTLRDSNREAWDVAKEVAAAEYGVVFFDEFGSFKFWNFKDVFAKQVSPVRSFDLSSVEGLNVRTTMDSVRNVWRVTTRSGYSTFNIAYDMGRDGVPYWKSSDNQYYPSDFRVPGGTWFEAWIPDSPNVVSVHPYLTKLAQFAEFEDHAPFEGYKPYQGTTYVGNEFYGFEAYIRKVDRDWSLLRLWGLGFNDTRPSHTVGFVGPNDIKRFRIAGTVITEEEPRNWEVENPTSRSKYGRRVIELGDNFWLQDRFQTEAMLTEIVSKIGRPIPVTDNITVAGDPRVQLGDMIEISDSEGMGEKIWLQILGIERTLEDGSGLTDTYQVEVVEPPGQWILGSSSYSILGQSTILS